MDPAKTGFADPHTPGFRYCRTHRADEFLYYPNHELAVQFGHRRDSETGRLPETVLAFQ
jgi:hypothetical protein